MASEKAFGSVDNHGSEVCVIERALSVYGMHTVNSEGYHLVPLI